MCPSCQRIKPDGSAYVYFQDGKSHFESIFYKVRSDNPSLNAEINIGNNYVSFRSTLGIKCDAGNQEFSPWIRLTNRNIVKILFQFSCRLC